MAASCSLCDATAEYRAVMRWCDERCLGGHPLCAAHAARVRVDPDLAPDLVRLHTLETA